LTRIGLLSDTHSYLDERLFDHFKDCDEIWHAGDVGTRTIVDQLQAFKPLRAVLGNIDSRQIDLPEHQHFKIEGLRVWITHIGGAPPRYNPSVRPQLKAQTPDVFICGHSHILRVLRDPALHNLLYINPGAAGKEGFHKVRTALRFGIDNGKILNMELIELGKRGAI